MADSTQATQSSGPYIPVGLGTKVGLLGTAILGVVAALGPLLDGFGSSDSKAFATLAAGVGAVTVFGRMLQSVAALLSSGQVQEFIEDIWEGEDTDTAPPSEDQLVTDFPEQPPHDPVTGSGKAGEQA